MSIQLLKKNSGESSDMDNYNRNIRMHRMRSLGIIAGAIAVVVIIIVLLWTGYQNMTYDSYEVVNSLERTDTMTTQYVEFKNYVLKYGKDGIACVDSSNRSIWSQTYNMQNPIITTSQESVAVAEENGTDALIFDADGLQGEIQTNLPIQQISVSNQGVLAALLEDGDSMKVNLYNKKGEELVTSKFELEDAGYPLKMSLSADGTKLAVTFLQVQDGSVNSCLAFYNFDSVGENEQDHLVSAQVLKGEVMPSVQYVDATHCFAVGTGELLIYEGKQIPEQVAEVSLDREVLSVFYSEDEIGLVLEGQEKAYSLQVYDVQGKLQFETEFDLDYQTLKFSKNKILIYNDFDCMILNHSGNIIFEGTFEESISNFYAQSGKRRYIVMHASKTDQIRLN